MRTTPARLTTQWHCWLLLHSFLGINIRITGLSRCSKIPTFCLKPWSLKRCFKLLSFFAFATATHGFHHLSCSVFTEIHNSLLLISALIVALSTESWVVLSDMGRVFHIMKSLIELRTLEWLCLAELCPRGWADRLVTLQASREDQFFAEILKQIKRFFRPYFHLQDTLWAISRHWHRLKNYFFVFAGCLCLSVSLWLLAKLSAYCTALCMYTLLVDAVWTSNPAKREPESLSCWMCFLSLPSLSSLGVKKELLCKGKLGFGRQICKI